MRTRTAAAFVLVTALLVGCSSAPAQKATPVEVTVTVTLPNGQPGRDLTLLLLPTSVDQMQGVGKTDASGKAKAQLTPGKYTFAFDNAPTTVPQKYHTNNAAHSVDVQSTTKELAIKLTN